MMSLILDPAIQVWDRETGILLADLSGRHEGRVFCVGSDCTKIVSCGEDQVGDSSRNLVNIEIDELHAENLYMGHVLRD